MTGKKRGKINDGLDDKNVLMKCTNENINDLFREFYTNEMNLSELDKNELYYNLIL